MGFPVHTLARPTCLRQRPVVAGAAVPLLHSSGWGGRSSLSCSRVCPSSAGPWLTAVAASALGTAGQLAEEIVHIYQSSWRTVSIPVNIHNKDHVTVKLLIDVKLEMYVGGRLLSWEFTLLGTPACFSLLSDMSQWETVLGLLPGDYLWAAAAVPSRVYTLAGTLWPGHGCLAAAW